MMKANAISAAEALERLKKGNETYLSAKSNPGDVSPEVRKATCEGGQHPYAIVVACSDSRVTSWQCSRSRSPAALILSKCCRRSRRIMF